MEEFTVKQIAEMLNTNPETVRRWIRSGKLESTLSSKKEGNVVSSEALEKFAKKMPKYSTLLSVAAMAGPILGPIAPFSIGMGVLAASKFHKTSEKEDEKINIEKIRLILQKDINKSKKKIQSNTKLIKLLEKEIQEEQEKVDQLTYLLEHENLEDITTEIIEKYIKEEK